MSTTTTPIMSAKSNKTAKLPAKPHAKRTPGAKPPAKRTRATKASKTAESSKTAELSAKSSETAKPTEIAEPVLKPSNSGTPAANIFKSGRLDAKPSETHPIQYHESAAEALVMGGVTNTATAKKLASMDWIRPVMVKEDRGLNMARPVNVEAILGYSRGELSESVCDCCTDGKGPFIECVTVQGMFAGSCTNCHYNSQGKYCNFRPEIKPRERSAPIASSSTVTAEGADRHRRVAKRKRSTTKEKWRRLLIAVEGVADAIENIMDEMED
ncbi:uncharacterized protein H6S33_001499 [Morchella sextelata]|uniref:uncharacterized protein n=1 Tax=Morchella sextelata TaxID=1174677 RepID=UPI001D04422B|nr:uncharacterized protein H6S33_001499 [Morchella sextelata]KAH0608365.1 hypothetical protein H6S33_001499 [Morchella sextelata]